MDGSSSPLNAATTGLPAATEHSASTPAISAPTSAPRVTKLVMTSIIVVPRSKSDWIPRSAPEMTPWS